MGKTLKRLATVTLSLTLAAALLFIGYRAWFRKIYPLQYLEQVQFAAQQHRVEQAMILAIIHTESSFDPQAFSRAGACGLMQLMPQTLEWGRDKCPAPFEEGDIFDPQTNVYYGTLVLQYQYQTFGNWETALAAYNVGGTTVSQWLKDVRYSEDGKRLHTIPYPETEHFVQRVLQAREMYRTLYD